MAGDAGSALLGGNFWQGALIGGTVAGLNGAMHKIDGPGDPKSKKWGATFRIPRLNSISPQGSVMAIITGQTRHIFGPDAISISLYGQVSSGANMSLSGGFIMTMNGTPEISRMYGIEAGFGTVNAGGGVVYTEYYCACSENKISTNLFLGKGWSTNVQLD
ncbi:hypothetical protein J2810_004782, partial [Chryseobacterium rhizosphaerae]|nr:hypothetical protein [Chryseobacterium rhizosphaerae]